MDKTKIINRLFEKITSGKWIMTVLFSITFCVLALKGKIGSEDFEKVIMVVMYAYFQRHNGRKDQEVKNVEKPA